MAAFSTSKPIPATAVAQSATVEVSVMDMANMRSVSVQITKTGIGQGSAKLQWSIDGVVWKDINTTQNPEATATVAVTNPISYSLFADNVPGAQVRLLAIESGTAAISISGKWLNKLY
jgi:hypothetical protein